MRPEAYLDSGLGASLPGARWRLPVPRAEVRPVQHTSLPDGARERDIEGRGATRRARAQAVVRAVVRAHAPTAGTRDGEHEPEHGARRGNVPGDVELLKL